ncbi:collagen alpha-1(XXI) chain-like [Styela clava]
MLIIKALLFLFFIGGSLATQQNAEKKALLDIIFVVDGSGSIGPENFEIVKQWLVSQTVNIYEAFEDAAHVEVLQYSNKDTSGAGVSIGDSNKFVIPFVLGECVNNASCFSPRIMNMSYLSSGTYTYYALRRVMEVEFSKSPSYITSKKAMILVTDGRAHDGFFLQSWHDKYNDTVTAFAIGVGNYILDELQTIANGGTGNDRVFTFHDFSALRNNSSHFITALINSTDLMWSSWSPCSASCSPGIQMRTKTFKNATRTLSGSVFINQTKTCNGDLCALYYDNDLRCAGPGIIPTQCSVDAFRKFLLKNVNWDEIGQNEKIFESPVKGLRMKIKQIKSPGMNIKLVNIERYDAMKP